MNADTLPSKRTPDVNREVPAARRFQRPRQFSLAHLTLLGQAPPRLIRIAEACGYDFVGLRLIPFGLGSEPRYELHSDRSLLKRTKAALAATGVQVLDIELARIRDGVDVRSYRPALEAGAEIGARHVLTSIWTGNRSFARDQLALLCETSAAVGLTVELEFLPYASVRTLRDAAALLTAVDHANAGLCIDTLHFDRSGAHAPDLAGLPRHWFRYVQICDAPARWLPDEAELRRVSREERLLFGQGGIDVRAILAMMPDVPCSIELPNAAGLAHWGPQEFARRCLESARRYLAAPSAGPTQAADRPAQPSWDRAASPTASMPAATP